MQFFFYFVMLSLTDNNKADVIGVLNSTSRYLDGLLNIDNHPYFERMINQMYPRRTPCKSGKFF